MPTRRWLSITFMAAVSMQRVQGQDLCLDYIGFEASGGLDLWSVVAAQLNDDTLLDMATCNHLTGDVSIFFGNGDASFQPAVTLPWGPYPAAVAAADLDDDGHTDLVTANAFGARVRLNLGGGIFSDTVTYPVPIGDVWTLMVHDIDGDSIDDVLVPSGAFGGCLAVLVGAGDGSFAPAVAYLTDITATSIDLGDLNEDGYLDVVYTHLPGFGETVHFFSILWGTGPGTFGTRTHKVYPYTSLYALAADANGDDHVDVLTANFSSDSVSFFPGNGDGSFAPEVNYFGAFAPNYLDLVDLGLDGYDELLVSDWDGNAVNVFRGDGTGIFTGASLHVVSAVDPQSFAVGRLNADAYPDIMIAGTSGAYVGIIVNCTTTGIEEDTQAPTLGPNPADESLTISVALPSAADRVTMIDASGRIVLSAPLSGGGTRIDTRLLPAGPYLVRFSTARGGTMYVARAMVVH